MKKHERGQGLAEYAVLLVLALIALLFILPLFASMWSKIGPTLSQNAAQALSPMVTNPHAIERHGQAAVDVAAAFDDVGHCSMGNSIRLKNIDGRKMDICFESQDTNKVDIHVTNDQGGPITDIPSHDISAPFRYLRNVISKMGYSQMVAQYGDLPEWFQPLLDLLSH